MPPLNDDEPGLHEQRTYNGETRQWDGHEWQLVSKADPAQGGNATPGTAGLFSGGIPKLLDSSTIPDLWHGITQHPADTIKGFLKGSAEGLPTAAKIAQVAVPFVTGGASIPAQMALGGGTQIISDLADKAAGDPDAPQSFGSAAGRAALGAAIPGILGGTTRAIQAARAIAKQSPEAVGGLVGGVAGGYEGYKHDGLAGAAIGGLSGVAGGSLLANKLAPILKGLRSGSGVQSAAGPLARSVKTEAVPLAESAAALGREVRPVAQEMGDGAGSLDRYMPNTSTRGAVDRYMPNTSSSEMAEFGSEPQEHLSSAMDGLNKYGFNPGAGAATVDAEAPISEPAAAETSAASSVRVLPRNDGVWGPGSVGMNGESPEATTGFKGANNLLYDPNTPTEYLRQQLRDLPEDDPARNFLARALSQRGRISRSVQPTD